MSGINSGLIGGIVAFALLALFAPVMKRILYQWNSRKYQGYDRALDAKERAWLVSNSQRLSEEKSNQKYPLWTFLLWGGLLPVILGMGIVGVSIFLLHKAFLKPVDPATFSWLRIPFGVSFVLAMFLGISMAAIAMIVLSKISPTLRDYLTYNYGWGYGNPKARGEQEIHEELEHQLRKRQITQEDEYDGDYFSSLIFHRTSPAWKKWTASIFCLTMFFLVLDTQYAIDLREDKISVSPYFSLLTHVYQYQDVETISRECTLGLSDSTEHPYLSYNLHMTDGRKIGVFSLEGNGQTPHLDAIEGMQPLLVNAEFKPTIIDTALIVKLEPTNGQCIRLIKQTNDSDTSERIITLFELAP